MSIIIDPKPLLKLKFINFFVVFTKNAKKYEEIQKKMYRCVSIKRKKND